MKAFFERYPYWGVCLVAVVLVTFYWTIWASDRYVSNTVIVMESPQVSSQEMTYASMFGVDSGSNDLLLLREYLLSIDMVRKAQNELDIRNHYTNHGDFFSRMHDSSASVEELHRYYKKRVTITLDEYSQVLNIEVQAFTPEFAHELAIFLLKSGEEHMNEMGRRLAEEQATFLQKQVDVLEVRLNTARTDLLNYQNEYGLVSPTQTLQGLNQVISSLEGELARLQARRTALASSRSDLSPEMVQIESEIRAVRGQITDERGRLAQTTGDALNKISAGYQALELRAQFVQEAYSSALTALENTRIEAARTLKQISILQSPVWPEYSIEPRRLYNATAFAIIALFLAFIVNMLVLIIRDHRE